MDAEFEVDENKKSNDKELTQLFWNKFGTFTSVHQYTVFFSDLSDA